MRLLEVKTASLGAGLRYARIVTNGGKRNRAMVFWLWVIVPLGFYTKFYSGPAENWVHGSLGGVFYEIFWCLLAAWLFPRTAPGKIALAVLLCTCALEFLQLWHPAWLQVVRGYFIGQAILGDCFAWSDFLYYFIGGALGWLWIKGLCKQPSTSPTTSTGMVGQPELRPARSTRLSGLHTGGNRNK
jgi:hypothetical protein